MEVLKAVMTDAVQYKMNIAFSCSLKRNKCTIIEAKSS